MALLLRKILGGNRGKKMAKRVWEAGGLCTKNFVGRPREDSRSGCKEEKRGDGGLNRLIAKKKKKHVF